MTEIGAKIILWSGGVWPETPLKVIRNGQWSMELGDRIFMFHGEKDDEGAMHADMSTLRTLLQEAAKKNVTLVSLDECLGDGTDGAYKQADGMLNALCVYF